MTASTRGRSSFLLVLVALVVTLGWWGLTGSRAQTHPAAAGEAVAFPGGTFTVVGVGDVDLSHPMSGPGMKMPMGAGVPQIPEGFRRLEVDVTVVADPDENLHFESSLFRLHESDGRGAAPVAPEQGGSFVPGGGRLTRTLTFEVAADVTEPLLTIEGGARPIGLTLGHAPEGHAH